MLAVDARVKDSEIYEYNIMQFLGELSRLKARNKMIETERFMERAGG